MFQITDCKIESRERKNLYHFAAAKFYKCSQDGARIHLASELLQQRLSWSFKMRAIVLQTRKASRYRAELPEHQMQAGRAALSPCGLDFAESALTKISRLIMRAASRKLVMTPKPRQTRTRTQTTVIGRGSNIQVIDRLARVLELFAGNGREMKVREVATALHLRRSTAHRYLASLSRAGLLRTEGDGAIYIGPSS